VVLADSVPRGNAGGPIGAVAVAAEEPPPLNKPGDSIEIALGFRNQVLERHQNGAYYSGRMVSMTHRRGTAARSVPTYSCQSRRPAGRLADTRRLSDKALNRRKILGGGLRRETVPI